MNALIIAARVKKTRQRRDEMHLTLSPSCSQLGSSFLFLTFLLFSKTFSDQPGGSPLLLKGKEEGTLILSSVSPGDPLHLSVFWNILFSFFFFPTSLASPPDLLLKSPFSSPYSLNANAP